MSNECTDTITINGVEYVKKSTLIVGSEVIVRTYSAGVHIGTIKSRSGQEIVMTEARRLWSWHGAFTLNAVATKGVNRANSRISVSVPEITLLEAIEIIPICAGIDLSPTERGD